MMPSHLWSFNVIPVRLISAMVPLILIASGIFFAEPTKHWTFLVAFAVGLGYLHFIIATYYQWQGIKHAPDCARRQQWFLSLVILSGLFSVLLMMLGHTLLLSILSIGYFVLHVLANEHTFLSREISTPPYWAFLSLVIPIGALYAISLVHPSLYFNYSLGYPSLSLAERLDRLSGYFPVGILEETATMMTVFFVMVVPFLIYYQTKQWHYALGFAGIGMLTLGLLATITVINFMYLLHFVLVYHFVLLSLLFIKPMQQRGREALRSYLMIHIYIGIPLLILFILFMSALGTGSWLESVFHFQIFVAISIMHISASFLNEQWFRKLFGL